MADDFTVRFELDVAAATQNANRLSQSLGQVTSALESAQAPAQQVAQNLNAVSTASTQRTRQAANSTRATKQMSDAELQLAQGLYTQSQAYTDIGKASQAAASNRKRDLDSTASGFQSVSRSAEILGKNLESAFGTVDSGYRPTTFGKIADDAKVAATATEKLYSDMSAGAQSVSRGLESTLGPQSPLGYVPTTFGKIEDSSKRALQSTTQYYADATRGAQSVAKGLESTLGPAEKMSYIPTTFGQIEQSTRSLGTSLPTLRYALYDVASTLGIVGGALIGANVAALGFAVSWERSFANVIRTSGAVGSEVENIRSQLIGLTRALPVSFSEVTEIATLGGQLGIAAGDLDEFTSVVARLTATTNLSAEAAGTALGRFQALMDVPASEFENLASAILNVGVNSVATETQIVAISTQISSMGKFAGLSAAEVVGLAGALASVGAQPELSRGTITRVFVQMSRAVASGGDRLSEFARVAGVTANQFRASFGTADFGSVFLQFIEGITREGRDAVQTLNNLGITSVRDVPLLQRLALASDEVRQAFSDSITAYRDATVLQEQYGIIAETTASRLKVLTQGFEELLATIGGSGTGPLKEFVNFLIDSLHGLTDFLNTDFGQGVSLSVIVLTTLVGTLLLVGAGIATLGATMAANITVFQLLTGRVVTLNGVLATTGIVMRGVALGATALIGALAATHGLKALGEGIAEAINPEWAKGVEGSLQRVEDSVINMFGSSNSKIRNIALTGTKMSREMSDWFPGPMTADVAAIDNFDRKLADFLRGGGSLADAQEYLNRFRGMLEDPISNEELVASLPRVQDALRGVAGEGENTAAKMEELVAAQRDAEAAAKALENRNEILAASFEITGDALEALSQSYVKAMGQFGDIGDILKRSQEQNREWAESVADETGNAKDSWEDYYDGVSVGLEQFMAGLQEDMLAQAQFATNIARLMAMGYTAFAEAALATGPDAAQVVADALASPESLQSIEDSYRQMARVGTEAWFQDSSFLIKAAMDVGDQAGAEMVAAIATADPKIIQDTIIRWGIIVPFDSDFSEVSESYAQHKAMWEQPISIRGIVTWEQRNNPRYSHAGMYDNGFATGGYISGPGTSTSDSIPARLSDGEYVIRAAAVRKYGTGMFDALNRGVAKFATGGQVGGGSSFPNSMVTEFGPQSMAAVRGLGGQGGNVTVVLDDVAIAQAANRGNAKLVGQGVR
jgi:TP901 family phage tail tape measure protein